MVLLPETPGQRISELCNGNHITQKELAERIGVFRTDRAACFDERGIRRSVPAIDEEDDGTDGQENKLMKFSVWQRKNSDTYSKQIIAIHLGVTNNANHT